MGLTAAQTMALSRLAEQLPQAVLTRLDAALGAARSTQPSFAPVHDIIQKEGADRRLSDEVLAPLRPLTDRCCEPPKKPLLTERELTALWRLMTRRLAPEVEQVRRRLAAKRGEGALQACDALCAAAAEHLSAQSSTGADVSLAAAGNLLALLRLSPVLRRIAPKLGLWSRVLDVENMTAIRLAYRDASEQSDSAGPLFMEAAMAHLEEPCRILRLISASALERPSDRFLASSEFAEIGERLLQSVEGAVQALRVFDPCEGAQSGSAAAGEVAAVCRTIREFEEWIVLSPAGPWTLRLAAAKPALVAVVEERLKLAERVVAAALPRLGEGQTRGAEAPAAQETARRTEALSAALAYAAFVRDTRTSAPQAGFGSRRAKGLEAIRQHIDTCVDERLRALREGGPGEPLELRSALDAAGQLLQALEGDAAAALVRRRAAAA